MAEATLPQPTPDAGSAYGAGSQPTAAVRKKFATPPAKLACLACRASRTRCNGGHPCASCQTKARDCVYMPSKRGGARIRKKPKSEADAIIKRERLAEMPEVPPEPISIENYIDPGAGLKQLGDFYPDSDVLFESLFMSGVTDYLLPAGTFGVAPPMPVPRVPMVRTYRDDTAILEAYYVFIHPYFPILPPPTRTPPRDNPVPRLQNQPPEFEVDFEPTCPIALAISAVLALIPCPDDTNHASQESLRFRRNFAQLMAQTALETIEAENEIPESSTDPTEALSCDAPPSPPNRMPFHPTLPIELENVVALDILSVYEYAQRGNLKKMRSRAGQALVDAMAFNIHNCVEEDAYSEARRRVWWMTYTCVCQGSIVGNTKPTFAPFASSFTASYPLIKSDPGSFSFFIQAQQCILTATQFVIDLNKTLQENGDMSPIYQRMQALESKLEPLIMESEAWANKPLTATTVDNSEAIVAHSLRCMARIKLNSSRIKVHRYCAFFDLPIFTGKHCDLKSKTSSVGDRDLRRWPACSCSPYVPSSASATSPAESGSQGTMSPSSASMQASTSSPQSDSGGTMPISTMLSSPFSSHKSAQICLGSALNIAADFNRMPYPNPFAISPFPQNSGTAPDSGNTNTTPVFLLSPTSPIIAPRTMPSFACCAMQCAYSLLMVYQKTKAMYPYLHPNPTGVANNMMSNATNSGQPLASGVLLSLQQGLMSIYSTLENYATAFEALGGMRDQIRTAVESTMGMQM